jgi:hypothetical protein
MIAADCLKVLEFMLTQANHAKHAPLTQQGVQVILDGRELSFVAVDSGSTTTVQMQPQRVSGGKGDFFIPFDDLECIFYPLRWECTSKRGGTAEVVITRSEQPLVPGRPCLKILIGDASENYFGNFKPGGHPKRSAIHALNDLTVEDIRNAAHSIKALNGREKRYSYKRLEANSYRVELIDPIAGTKSVTKMIY